MKKFQAPQMEVVHFEKMDVLTSSPGCACVDCLGACGEGSYDCTHVDFPVDGPAGT